MAPAASKTRDNQFFNVGVQGRKTGITLKDTGVRDEHGMEPIDGIFSSPEKSPPKRNNARPQADKTLTSSDMDVQQSMPRQIFEHSDQPYYNLVDELLASDEAEEEEATKTTLRPTGSMPEPADALTARKSIRPGRSSMFPPPMGRSPIKTALGSSPRRQSMGPPSGMRRASGAADRAVSHPAVARRLDFGAIDEDNAKVTGSGSRNRGQPRPHVFDLPVSPARGKKRTHDESVVEDETVLEESEVAINGVGEDSPLPTGGEDDTLPMLLEETGGDTEPDESVEDSMEIPEEPQPRPQLTKFRGPARKSLEHKESPASAPKKKAGRPKKNQGLVSAKSSSAAVPARSRTAAQPRLASKRRVTDESAMDVDQSIEELSMEQASQNEAEEEPEEKIEEEEEEEEPEPVLEPELEPEFEEEPEPTPEPELPPAKKKRGRPKSGSKVDIHVDEPQDPVQLPERPAKKAKKTAAPKKPPPSQRDPNARITSNKDNAKSRAKGKQKEDMPPPPLPSQPSSQPERGRSRQPSQARSLQILRQGTPFDDVGARTTRSGRISAKPVEYWRNERIEYGHDGTKKEIIRAEDVEETKRPAARAKGRKRAGKRSESAMDEEPGMELEEWEVDPGVVQGWVNGWDEKARTVVNEGGRNEDIAYSAAALETREVAGANFRYSKVLGIPYFGAGVVDIPPHGAKRSKNSRRMYMAFCLLSGKVSVTVGDNEFSISKGGVWMVPRGE
ncbi:mitotic fidelity of chromosome transmission-related protein [Diplodia intermedia]|uniref:Mitotic fidelity of chromosome transmission-related protein n=1 Tax=Diplodia intermedia TaxID=856260 RepID=A0ABR3T2V3_9PEZI